MSHLHGCRAGVVLCRTDIRHTGVIRCVIVIIVPSCVIRSSLIVIKVTTCVNISPPIVIEATTCHYVAIPRLSAPAGFLYMGTMVFHIRGYGLQTWTAFPYTRKSVLKKRGVFHIQGRQEDSPYMRPEQGRFAHLSLRISLLTAGKLQRMFCRIVHNTVRVILFPEYSVYVFSGF